jgi:hypothetical protein
MRARHRLSKLPLRQTVDGCGANLLEKATWVAMMLDAVTYYTRQELPLLCEAVQDLRTPPESFFQYSVAQIEDEQATLEELETYFGSLAQPDDDWYCARRATSSRAVAPGAQARHDGRCAAEENQTRSDGQRPDPFWRQYSGASA